jgi:hypothetical protein
MTIDNYRCNMFAELLRNQFFPTPHPIYTYMYLLHSVPEVCIVFQMYPFHLIRRDFSDRLSILRGMGLCLQSWIYLLSQSNSLRTNIKVRVVPFVANIAARKNYQSCLGTRYFYLRNNDSSRTQS